MRLVTFTISLLIIRFVRASRNASYLVSYGRATLNEFAGLKNFAGGLPGGPLVILLVELVIVNFLHFCSKLLKNKYVQWTQLIESCPEMVFLGHIYRYHRNSSSIWAQFGPIWLDLTGCLGEVTNKIGGAIFSSKLKRKLFFEVPSYSPWWVLSKTVLKL